MKYQNIIISLVIPLALLSIPSLLENVQAQTNSANQTQPQQQNQNMNITAQALMKVDIFELKDTLMKASLAVVDGNREEALTGVKDIESQLLEIEPSPTKFLWILHKALKAIDSSDIDKSLDTLTQLQVTIFKAENQIFKAAVADPQVMQQFDIMKKPNTNEEEEEEDYEKDKIQQFLNNEEPDTNEED
jgi:ribosomal protein S10